MRVLFALHGEVGHVTPFVGICQQLVRAGHEIAIHCPRRFDARFARAGLSPTWFGASDRPIAPPHKMAEMMKNPEFLDRWMSLAFSMGRSVIASIQGCVDAFAPDVLCVDPILVPAAIVATRAQLPWVVVSTNFNGVRPMGWTCPFLDASDRLAVRRRDDLEKLCTSHGVPAVEIANNELVSPWFNAVLTTEVIAPRHQSENRHSHYVGPARFESTGADEAAFPWELLDDRPLVYVSGGGGQSLGFDAETSLRIARSLTPSEATIVMAAPGLAADAAFRAAVPSSCIVTDWAPQERLLARAAAAVIHGGANSFNEAIDRGCPMLVLPLGKDQPLQAELARRSGVGLALDPSSLTEEACRGALLELLAEDSPQRRQVTIARDSYQATDSAAMIGAAIETAARGERPAWPT